MGEIINRVVVLGLFAVALAGCAAYAEVGPVDYGYVPPRVDVPDGHLPPPGACRIWYPDRPPGHQPPPGPCHVLKYEVPPGAHLIRG